MTVPQLDVRLSILGLSPASGDTREFDMLKLTAFGRARLLTSRASVAGNRLSRSFALPIPGNSQIPATTPRQGITIFRPLRNDDRAVAGPDGAGVQAVDVRGRYV